MIRVVPGHLSTVFISFDEPNADANFASLRTAVPTALRIHGVRGFDAAHNRAGDIAETAHVITVDGDNAISDTEFFTRPIELIGEDLVSVISFSARIRHNGLQYGNGGLKIWPRPLLRSLRTHERAIGIAHPIDFVWRIPYVSAQGIPTETVVTGTPRQAFRAGFREGYRLTMTRGVPPMESHQGLSPADALARHVTAGNLERIRVWCAVGRDAPNGEWAMLGARRGLLSSATEEQTTALVADFPQFGQFWEDLRPGVEAVGVEAALRQAGQAIQTKLGLEIPELDAPASRFLKSLYRPVRRPGRIVPQPD
jgi:hypothetical protein